MVNLAKLDIPRDNGDSFAVLVENGILSGGLREPLMAIARFRNRLVRLYWEVDDVKVREYLETSLDDSTCCGAR